MLKDRLYKRTFFDIIKIDPTLMLFLLILSAVGLMVLYSASGQSSDTMIRQTTRLLFSFTILLVVAQISPQYLKLISPWVFIIGIIMLILVLLVGDISKGAQRWLNIYFFRLQPSEWMKIALPMAISWYLHDKPHPLKLSHFLVAMLIILLPVILIFYQPDLGTAILVGISGLFVIFLAGLSWWFIGIFVLLFIVVMPYIMWNFVMHAYQKTRVLTFINPETDMLGAGYHITQSKIAIGSGGNFGHGWLNSTQSGLDFLPERTTDFIFAVFGEEFGFLGAILLLCLYLIIVYRGLYIAIKSRNLYDKFLAGSLSLTFFIYFFVNIGMVIGILPVVGIPLPLVSYGGTSMVTLCISFGMIMSIHSFKRLL
ncbi:MAG: rod shape-determining protein RodA [Gammaproteobacteria bacterium]|nr:MAG: rod shape-determining protein RodA [Gammaproteobacteria bacterium]